MIKMDHFPDFVACRPARDKTHLVPMDQEARVLFDTIAQDFSQDF